MLGETIPRQRPTRSMILTLALLFVLLPAGSAHAAMFCKMVVTGVRITDAGRMQIRAHELTQTSSDQILLRMCNIVTKEGTVEPEACKAWHTEALSALYTGRVLYLQLREADLEAGGLGTTCTSLVNMGAFWDATTSVEAW